MNKTFIAVSSVTYALKGRDILLKNGFKNVSIQRIPGLTQSGCGYGIYVDSNVDRAAKLLAGASIPIIRISRDGS